MRRFSIRSLTAFIVVAAIILAALRNASDLWAGSKRRLELRSVFMQVRGRKESDPALIATKRSLAKVDQQLAAADAVPPFDQFQRVGHSLFTFLAGLLGGTVAV